MLWLKVAGYQLINANGFNKKCVANADDAIPTIKSPTLIYKRLGIAAEDLSADDEDERGLYRAIIDRNNVVWWKNEQAYYKAHHELDPQRQAI